MAAEINGDAGEGGAKWASCASQSLLTLPKGRIKTQRWCAAVDVIVNV